ncbi:hypothetical protein HDV05_004620 [Chytridiales sp. JEL 0842]|nr:hypothetical protein HDV05_004620 [Chytridiales sp. JEL 0842]
MVKLALLPSTALIGTTILTVSTLFSTVTAQRELAKFEPADGKLIFAAWLLQDPYPEGLDSPKAFNERIGYSAGSFQLGQSIPYSDDPFNPGKKIIGELEDLNDGTDASMFLTVYPDQRTSAGSDLDLVTDEAIQTLVDQLKIISAQRKVFVRFGPEMNGQWMLYGKKPDKFKETWIRVTNAIRQGAPGVAMVWSPNFWAGEGDDYAPYFPGPDFVDWIGISVYWKGSKADYPWFKNTVAPSNYFAQIIDAAGPEGGATSIYKEYCVKYGKPLVLSEGAAAFHVNVSRNGGQTYEANDAGPGQAAVVMSFWNSFMNPTFLKQYPLLKMVHTFEHVKPEDESGLSVYRDFRVSKDPATLAELKKTLATLDAAGIMQWANPVSGSEQGGTATRGSGAQPSGTGSGAAVTTTKSPGSGALASFGASGLSGAVISLVSVALTCVFVL